MPIKMYLLEPGNRIKNIWAVTFIATAVFLKASSETI